MPVSTRSKGSSRCSPLSLREAEVRAALCTGACNEEIAARLRINCRTVESRLHQVYAKLGVRGRAVAMVRALGGSIEDPSHEAIDPEPGPNHERERRTEKEPSRSIRHSYPAPQTT